MDMLQLKILNKIFQINSLNGNATALNRQLVAPTIGATINSSDEESSPEGTAVGDSFEDVLRANTEEGVEIEIISNLQEIDLFRHLECIIKDVHLLWELVITNEPIIVIGNSPSISSQVVQSLVR